VSLRCDGRVVRVYTVGQVVHTLPRGPPVIGVTTLDDKIYLLRAVRHDQVEVYDAIKYQLLRCLTVPNIRGLADMTICRHYRCVYVADGFDYCVHRVGLHGGGKGWWPVNDEPNGLSLNKSHNVLVTCSVVHKIKEFNSDGNLLRELTLPDDVISPWHAIQLANGEFIVCHGGPGDAVHRVCKVSADGRHIVHSHGGQRGSDTGQYNVPVRLAVDNNEFVFVADTNNRRVTLLSPTLNYIRQVVSRDKLKRPPTRLHLDVHRQRLYVAANEYKNDQAISGRVVVFSV